MKILAFYLPQYHSIKENDEWWGKNYTEWNSVKRGKKLIEGQYQPRIPLNNNYYNLLDIDVIKWQTKIAKENGIYGFCVYHYWFNGKLLLEKPMEQYLKHKEIDYPFCFCWANEDWSNIWEGNLKNLKILISNTYDDKDDWEKHFFYLLPFFRDKRYIKVENKPLFVIYNPLLIPTMKKIIKCWNKLAVENGFDGLILMYQSGKVIESDDKRKDLFKYGIEYYPGLVGIRNKGKTELKKMSIKHNIATFMRQRLNIKLDRKIKENLQDNTTIKEIEYYDEIWDQIISYRYVENNIIPGAFVDWDNTPRRGYAGKVILGSNPELFEKYFEKQLINAKDVYKKDLMFIFAWNEWSEGGYLEPDEKYGFGYLNAIRNVLLRHKEFPNWENKFEIEK